MNKRILFVWNYFYFPFEKGKSRFSDLVDSFVKDGYEVEVVCSSFYHMGKITREIDDPRYQSFNFKVSFIREPGYSKNVSLDRVRSIRSFNQGVKDFLSSHDPVDFVYVPVPSMKLASICEKWANKTGAKCLIDVEDLWPESFEMIVHPRWLSRLFFWPMKIEANRTYRRADAVVAVSNTYLDRVKKVRKKPFPSVVAPIGADLEYVSSLLPNSSIKKPQEEFWLSYIGTFGKSYDLRLVIDAVSELYERGRVELVFKIMGSGPDEEALKAYALTKPGRFDFLGILPYDQMCQILAVSDLGVNPIVKGSAASLINKVADYAACSLPVLNTQDCPEYVELLSSTKSGISVPPGEKGRFVEALSSLIYDRSALEAMRSKVPTLAQTYFSRAKSQSDILALITSIYGTQSKK